MFSLCFSLLYAQTVVVPIPGERNQPQQPQGGGGGSGVGALLGVAVGFGIMLLLSKVLSAKPSRPKALNFIPFQFIALYEGELPEGLEVIEEESLERLRLSLIKWEKEEMELEEKLRGRVIALERNLVYEVYGQVETVSAGEVKGGERSLVAVLDTGADTERLRDILVFSKNMRRDPYTPEPHGSAVSYLVNLQKGAGVGLYRVCSQSLCDGWSIAKALVDLRREGIRLANLSFGTHREDRVVGYLIRLLSSLGHTFVAPVGNEPMDDLPFPARLPQVLSVAGSPCFPKPQCRRAKERERYITETPFGRVFGTSFSSAIVAGRLAD